MPLGSCCPPPGRNAWTGKWHCFDDRMRVGTAFVPPKFCMWTIQFPYDICFDVAIEKLAARCAVDRAATSLPRRGKFIAWWVLIGDPSGTAALKARRANDNFIWHRNMAMFLIPHRPILSFRLASADGDLWLGTDIKATLSANNGRSKRWTMGTWKRLDVRMDRVDFSALLLARFWGFCVDWIGWDGGCLEWWWWRVCSGGLRGFKIWKSRVKSVVRWRTHWPNGRFVLKWQLSWFGLCCMNWPLPWIGLCCMNHFLSWVGLCCMNWPLLCESTFVMSWPFCVNCPLWWFALKWINLCYELTFVLSWPLLSELSLVMNCPLS